MKREGTCNICGGNLEKRLVEPLVDNPAPHVDCPRCGNVVYRCEIHDGTCGILKNRGVVYFRGEKLRYIMTELSTILWACPECRAMLVEDGWEVKYEEGIGYPLSHYLEGWKNYC